MGNSRGIFMFLTKEKVKGIGNFDDFSVCHPKSAKEWTGTIAAFDLKKKARSTQQKQIALKARAITIPFNESLAN